MLAGIVIFSLPNRSYTLVVIAFYDQVFFTKIR